MKALDIILFKGVDFISDIILKLQKKQLGQGDWSHVGLIVSKEILDDNRLQKDCFYFWESTMSGKFNDSIPNIEGDSFFGVQLRQLGPILEHTEKLGGKYKLLSLKIKDVSIYKEKFTKLFEQLNNTHYDSNLFSLLCSLYPKLRCMRSKIEKFLHTENWLFCSELCALTYKELGIVKKINPKNIVPQDFINGDDKELEEIFEI